MAGTSMDAIQAAVGGKATAVYPARSECGSLRFEGNQPRHGCDKLGIASVHTVQHLGDARDSLITNLPRFKIPNCCFDLFNH